MKPLFKPALTANWPSDKGLRGLLNRDGRRFLVIRFAASLGGVARTMNSSGNSSGDKTIRYRFGRFELDPSEGALSRSGTRVKLQDLPFRLLVLLVEHPG